MDRYYGLISDACDDSIRLLKEYGQEVDTGTWQGVSTEGKPDMVTRELINLSFQTIIPEGPEVLANATGCNMPWAEDHFQERVSRVPSNPGEEYKNWPWWQGQDEAAMVKRLKMPHSQTEADAIRRGEGKYEDSVFTHTYQERFWPRQAGLRNALGELLYGSKVEHRGIRYRYGDLDDVVNLLVENPYDRAATFPIFFPEDTGRVHRGRTPCSLHYHFLLRNDHLHLWYPIRSCDAVRHFRDDVYMAGRLCQWVIGEAMLKFEEWKQSDPKTMNRENIWRHIKPGMMHFTAYSFHVHMGDIHRL